MYDVKFQVTIHAVDGMLTGSVEVELSKRMQLSLLSKGYSPCVFPRNLYLKVQILEEEVAQANHLKACLQIA